MYVRACICACMCECACACNNFLFNQFIPSFENGRIYDMFANTDIIVCHVFEQAAQNAQRDSQELFQSIFFRDHDDDDSVCIADAVIYQLRANGVLVFVPRLVHSVKRLQ